MDDETLASLVERIRKRLISKDRKIDGETYIYLLDFLAKPVEERADRMPDALDELKDCVYAARSYDHASDLDGFDMGACWGMLKLHDALISAAEEKLDQQRQINAVRRHQDILVAMQRNMGITQSELANKTGNSRSNLSQILARLKPYHLFFTSAEGRNKHYTLTSRGERLLESVSRKHRWSNEENAKEEPYYFAVAKRAIVRVSLTRDAEGATVEQLWEDTRVAQVFKTDGENYGISLKDAKRGAGLKGKRSSRLPHFDNGSMVPANDMAWIN